MVLKIITESQKTSSLRIWIMDDVSYPQGNFLESVIFLKEKKEKKDILSYTLKHSDGERREASITSKLKNRKKRRDTLKKKPKVIKHHKNTFRIW